jgi:hypothetical protein
MKVRWAWWVILPLAALSNDLALAEPIKGRILGEQCAKLGKIGECYLKWADPMVFWTQDGDYYPIKLAGKELDQVALDKAFGQEVEVEGTLVKDGPDKGAMRVSKLTLLNPPGKKEFFKG